MSPIVVRRAVAADAAAIAAVHVRAWESAYRGIVRDDVLDTLTVEGRTQTWELLLAANPKASVTTVAEIDGTVAGFCSIATPARDESAPPGTAEIPAIYVDPDRHGRGIGRALLEAALGDLEQDGWARVTLWVLVGNDAARGFYLRLGFTPDGALTTLASVGADAERLGRDLALRPRP